MGEKPTTSFFPRIIREFDDSDEPMIYGMKKMINKDKHHISWKNHGIEEYINKALEIYLKKTESSK